LLAAGRSSTSSKVIPYPTIFSFSIRESPVSVIPLKNINFRQISIDFNRPHSSKNIGNIAAAFD
jgi:hypothetical protein